MSVVNHPASNRNLPISAVDQVIRPDDSLLKACCISNNLKDRTRLVWRHHRLIDIGHIGRDVALNPVRIEGRCIGQRQNLTGRRIHDDHPATLGTMLSNRLLEQHLSLPLQNRIDRQMDGCASCRRQIEAPIGLSPGVGQQRDLAVFPTQQFIVASLNPRKTEPLPLF